MAGRSYHHTTFTHLLRVYMLLVIKPLMMGLVVSEQFHQSFQMSYIAFKEAATLLLTGDFENS